jgi:hypothetical protein
LDRLPARRAGFGELAGSDESIEGRLGAGLLGGVSELSDVWLSENRPVLFGGMDYPFLSAD